MFKFIINGLGVFIIIFLLAITYSFVSTGSINWKLTVGFSVLCSVVFLCIDYVKNKNI